MPCKACGSDNLRSFSGEIAIHFRGLKNINEPVVWVFPEIAICLNCGAAEFVVPASELRLLARRTAAGA